MSLGWVDEQLAGCPGRQRGVFQGAGTLQAAGTAEKVGVATWSFPWAGSFRAVCGMRLWGRETSSPNHPSGVM